MVTTKQKPIIDSQKIMRKESKHNSTETHQITREESKRRRKKERRTANSQKTMIKMAISTYL